MAFSCGGLGRFLITGKVSPPNDGGIFDRVQGSGFRVQGSGFRVQGSGFRVQGSGFRVNSKF